MVATLLALVVGPQRASAEPAKEPPPRELAKKQYQQAVAMHDAGDYAGAAVGYLKAYDLLPQPLFIYNAAVVFRLDGEKQKALEHYKEYLELEPDGKGAESAKKFVALLESELGTDTENPAGPGTGTDTENSAGAGTGAGSGDTSVDAKLEEGEVTPLPSPEGVDLEGLGGGKRIAGLVVTGIGVAIIGGGIGFGVQARSLSTEASEFRGPAGVELDDLYERGEAADRNMVILISAGVLTAAAGGVIYYLGVRDRRRAKSRLEIFATPTSAGVSGRF